ncbi:MAG: long-chain fatty acid--CoA ligase, partial [Deltaproteobacteria bacterium]
AHILGDSESTVVFVEDPSQLEKLFDPRVRPLLRNVRRVVYLDARRRLDLPDARGRLEVRLDDVLPREDRATVTSLAELVEAGRRVLERDAAKLRARGEAVTPDDVATLVYTSGTSGPPKGVALTHANFAFECASVGHELQLTAADEQLLILPLAHIFARVLLVSAIRVGFVTAFASSPLSALDDAQEVHPTILGAVPRVFEKVHASALRRVAGESPLRRRAADLAFRVGLAVSRKTQRGESPGAILAAQHRVASALLFEQISHLFGRRLRFAISGGAPLRRDLAEWFHAAGVLVLEGYGLTETTAATHMNRPSAYRLGTVGRPVPGVEARIEADGEILVRGGNVMKGYFKRADETAEVIDGLGWFHTGDVGVIDAEGYLTITDRKKDLIVTAGGKNVAPRNLELALEASPWIANAAVFGDARPYLVALVSLDQETARGWARDQGLDLAWGEIVRDARVRAIVERAVADVNAQLEPYQRIRGFAIAAADFSIEADEITPTLKLRRRSVAARHAAEIDALYR